MEQLHKSIQEKIDLKTKPLGALGRLEETAHQICMVQKTLSPELVRPTIIIFAADHGSTASGVSAYPAAVTPQMVLNFLNGGAAINVFCQQHDIDIKIVDAGVNYDFAPHPLLIHAKIAKGTKNFLLESAMTADQLQSCFAQAKDIVDAIADSGCNIIGFGEMGIGNTSSASLIMSALCSLPIAECVGKGTGMNKEQLEHKIDILTQAQANHSFSTAVETILQNFGGFEIAQMCGAMLQSYDRNMLIMIDGFIASAAFLCAYQINPAIKNNAIFCHESDEQGHQKMLQHLKVKPLINLNMRVGEGTGCAVAYPIIKSAVAFMNRMASFESAGVANKD